MPPRISRLCRESKTAAPRCTAKLRSLPFSTSSIQRAAIPPESPRFIEIPRPVQPQAFKPQWVKGVLPSPRRVFTPKPYHQIKATPDYLASVTPEPLKERAETADARTKDLVGWKERQAARRRQNLREGLIELQYRDARTSRGMVERSSRIQAQNLARRDAPEREDERLTHPSVLTPNISAKHGGLPDPSREARMARKKKNVVKMQAMRQEKRRQELHTLYVNAQKFIITPAQLDRAIDKAFDDLSQFSNEMNPGLNIWNTGLPETIAELLKSRTGSSDKFIDLLDENSEVTKRRVKKIAEELTGGKMEDV